MTNYPTEPPLRTLTLSEVIRLFRFDWNNSFIKETWGSGKKAILGSFAAVGFGGAILLLSFLAVTNPLSVSPYGTDPEIVLSVASGPGEPRSSYYLPYPGLLPDNPVYKVKALRDKLSLWMTRGDAKKAEKELLFADKRINAAEVLIGGGKVNLGVSTATKAEKYLQSSVDRILRMAGEGKDVKSMLTTLANATRKHTEMLEQMVERTEGQQRQVLEKTLENTRMLEGKVAQAQREVR